MTNTRSAGAAALIVLLASGSAFAQWADKRTATIETRPIAPVSRAAIFLDAIDIEARPIVPASEANVVIDANGAARTEAAGTASWLSIYGLSFETHRDRIGEFVQRTAIVPIKTYATDVKNWLAATPGQAVSIARDTCQWITANWNASLLAVNSAGAQIASSTQSMINSAIGSASATFGNMTNITIWDDWSGNLAKRVENHLRADPSSEFAKLVEASGFVITDVKVGVGLIPELAVKFLHERDLTHEEIAAFKHLIENHAKTSSGVTGYFERLLLRNLASAGDYAGNLRISEVHIDVFPLPDLELFFDPFNHDLDKNKMIINSSGLAKKDSKEINVIESRIKRIERLLSETETKNP